MTPEERIKQLEQENEELRAEVAALQQKADDLVVNDPRNSEDPVPWKS